jgi:hypothetical protein
MDIASPSEYLEQAQIKYTPRMSIGLFGRTKVSIRVTKENKFQGPKKTIKAPKTPFFYPAALLPGRTGQPHYTPSYLLRTPEWLPVEN